MTVLAAKSAAVNGELSLLAFTSQFWGSIRVGGTNNR